MVLSICTGPAMAPGSDSNCSAVNCCSWSIAMTLTIYRHLPHGKRLPFASKGRPKSNDLGLPLHGLSSVSGACAWALLGQPPEVDEGDSAGVAELSSEVNWVQSSRV